MTGRRCDGCGRTRAASDAGFRTATGRVLCVSCRDAFAGLAGAGVSMTAGEDVGTSVAAGVGAAQWAGAMADDAAAARLRREKVAAASGRWAKFKAWLIG